MITLVTGPIDIPSVLESVQSPSAGGIDIFIGTTRDSAQGRKVVALDYEAYQPMALDKMQEIAGEAQKKWDLTAIALVHRTGRVEAGEASVVIAVSAPHRKEAFEACRFAIDALKKDVPIWKKEIFSDGEAWVESHG